MRVSAETRRGRAICSRHFPPPQRWRVAAARARLPRRKRRHLRPVAKMSGGGLQSLAISWVTHCTIFNSQSPHFENLRVEKSVNVDPRLAKDRSQSPFFHVASVMRKRDLAAGLNLTPDLVAARSLSIVDVTECPQFLNNVTIL